MGADDSGALLFHASRGLAQVRRRLGLKLAATAAALVSLLLIGPAAAAAATPYLSTVPRETLPIATTVPSNGDQNPYGIVTVPTSIGLLRQGDLLVSNFNNDGANGGQQGTGTTIVQIPPGGARNDPRTASVFAQIARN